jgi:hypothetical protein
MKDFLGTVTGLCLILLSIWLVISNIIFWGKIEAGLSNCCVIVACFIINLLTYFKCTQKFMFKELFTIKNDDDEELD